MSKWDSTSHLPACAEEAHYDHQWKAFYLPETFDIYAKTTTDATRYVFFRDLWNKKRARQIERLNPDDCRIFCWKDCAIYDNVGLSPPAHDALFDAVYNEWFPHRARAQDVSAGSIFAKPMRFAPAAIPLREIMCFHAALCEKLHELEQELPDIEPINPHRPPSLPVIQAVVDCKLRETCPVVFIVLDIQWQQQGVLLVWRSKDVASRHKCEEGGEILKYDSSDGDDLGQACVYRCPLRRAMQLVLSTDPERSSQRGEYSEYLRETLGEDGGDNSQM